MAGNWWQRGREWLAGLGGRTGSTTPASSTSPAQPAGVTLGPVVPTGPIVPVIPLAPVTLTPGQPVSTRGSQLLVAGMAPGFYTFQLIVEDNLGAKSKPATLQIQVIPIIT